MVYGALGSARVPEGSIPIRTDLCGGSHPNGHLSMPVGKDAKVVKGFGLKNAAALQKHGRYAVVWAEVAIVGGGRSASKIGNLMLREWVKFASVQGPCW